MDSNNIVHLLTQRALGNLQQPGRLLEHPVTTATNRLGRQMRRRRRHMNKRWRRRFPPSHFYRRMYYRRRNYYR